MKGAIIHGVLLAVMLIYGYRTISRDTKAKADLGSVVVFDKKSGDLASLVYKTDAKTVTLTRRGQGADAYWWGTEVRREKKAKPAPPTPTAAASKSTEGEVPAKKPITEFEDVEVTSEFPVSDTVVELASQLAGLRALRQLPLPTAEETKAFGLAEKTAKLELAFAGGARTLTIGGRVSGGSERYALDETGKRLLIIAGSLVEPLAGGETGLRLTDPKGFDVAKVDRVTIAAGGKQKILQRGAGKDDKGNTTKTWIDSATGAPDQTAANFISSIDRLRPSKYRPDVDLGSDAALVTLTYADKAGQPLGSVAFHAKQVAGSPPAEAAAAPASPAPTTTEYYLVTARARAPGLLDGSMASRVEADLATVFQ
ncbi:MAG: DUF4340 domain-containing protein [Myxococcales bacterium]|nr:DUF4340 domain-containing protein [Myxococcales bacterium]